MPLPQQSWTVSCRACDLVIGAVEGGRFVHDEACAQPLAIGTGQLRCCQCGGRLVGEAHPVAGPAPSDNEEIVVSLLRFPGPDLLTGETRQRL
jgi:hypothetical protein